MYRVGDKVMHQKEGACYINDIVMMEMNSIKKKYYLLTPLIDEKACIYISMEQNNQDRIRPVVSSALMKKTEDEVSNVEPEWVSDDKQRNKLSAEVLKSFDFVQNIRLVKNYIVQNKEKNLGVKDQQTLMAAQKLVYSEIAIVLDQDYNNVSDKMEKYYLGS